jgi:hypothetical protein
MIVVEREAMSIVGNNDERMGVLCKKPVARTLMGC